MLDRLMRHRLMLESAAVFAGAFAVLLSLGATAPFTKELGVCESGAVRDVLAGNIILPHFIPGPIVHVPPLYWWSAAGFVRLIGWTELALRLPALIPSALTCAIVYAWGAHRLSREAAIWGGLALLLCHFFIDAARQPRMDAMLAMFVTGAIAALDCAINNRQRMLLIVAAVAIGLGCLTKGILGIALPGAAIGLHLIGRGRFVELFRPALIAAFVAGLAIGLAWYVAGYEIDGRKFLQWQIGMNLWSRFIPAEAGGANYCVHPIWYFAPQIAKGLLPWSLYLPAFVFAAVSRRRTIPEPIVFMLCWFAAIFLFFSLSRGKCLVYILPAFPPLALMIGWTIAEANSSLADRWFARLFTAGTVTAALGICIVIAGAIVILEYHGAWSLKLHPTDQRYLEIFLGLAHSHNYAIVNWIAVSVIGILIALRGVRRALPHFEVFGVLLIAVAGARFWFGAMNPALAQHETLKSFAQEIDRMVPAGAAIGHIGIEDCDLYFYSSRPITPVFNFRCDAPQFPPYLVIRKNRLEAMPQQTRACLIPTLVSEAVDGNGPRLLVEQRSHEH